MHSPLPASRTSRPRHTSSGFPHTASTSELFKHTKRDVDDTGKPESGTRLRRVWVIVVAVAIIQGTTWLVTSGGAQRPALVIQMMAGWVATVALGVFAVRRIGRLSERLTEREHAHRATLDEIEQLQTQNAMLEIVARSVDVPLTFQALALRVARLVPCDRVGLALLSETGQEFETFTARVHEDERRNRPASGRRVKDRAHRDRTGGPDRESRCRYPTWRVSRERVPSTPMCCSRAGFKSALVMPLMSKGRGVGTLNVVVAAAGRVQPGACRSRCVRLPRFSRLRTSPSSCTCCSASPGRSR